MIESAYAKLCSGDTEEALFMFREVRDVAVSNKDDFLSQVSRTTHSKSITRKLGSKTISKATVDNAKSRCYYSLKAT